MTLSKKSTTKGIASKTTKEKPSLCDDNTNNFAEEYSSDKQS